MTPVNGASYKLSFHFFRSLRVSVGEGTIVFHRIFGLPWGDYRVSLLILIFVYLQF